MKVLFATSNKHKVAEANNIGGEYGVEFTQINTTYPEIRDDSVAAIAEAGVKHVYNQVKKPVVVEDSGLFIHALNDFPGPYSSFVFNRIGSEGILRLMSGLENRKAAFISAVAYTDGRECRVFEGVVEGLITEEVRGTGGFGYDPIFKPEGRELTFAQDPEHKNRVSHRRRAVEKLCERLRR
jgi:XTP/dITP diphosphohydrolase